MFVKETEASVYL